jgi:hypothetical protein
MYEILFIAALFLIVVLALYFDALLLPGLPAVVLGALCLLLGAGIAVFGSLRGGLYALSGAGVLVLQALGYFH